MICHACGKIAPTKHVKFHYNIGVIIIRFPRSIEGEICKSCVHKYFWQYQTITVLLGWWGIISVFLNTYFVLHNLFTYLGCLNMPGKFTDEQLRQLSRDLQRARGIAPQPGTELPADTAQQPPSVNDPQARRGLQPRGAGVEAVPGAAFHLNLSSGGSVPLSQGAVVPASEIPGTSPASGTTSVARVSTHPQNPGIMGLTNTSIRDWYITTADGRTLTVPPSKSVKLTPGTRINFGSVVGVIQ